MRWPFVVLSRLERDAIESDRDMWMTRALESEGAATELAKDYLSAIRELRSELEGVPSSVVRELRLVPPAVLSPVVVQPLSLDLANRARMRELDALAARDKE